jgi:hypothetical protein
MVLTSSGILPRIWRTVARVGVVRDEMVPEIGGFVTVRSDVGSVVC